MDRLDDWFITAMGIMLPLLIVMGLVLAAPWPGDLKRRRNR